MEYTKRVLTEVLRLHPSVPVNAREAVEDDVLPSGHPVHKGIPFTLQKDCILLLIIQIGASVVYSPYVMGRAEALYPNPLKLDPERWNEDNIKKIKPGQYSAFHWGPYTCLQQQTATNSNYSHFKLL